MEYTWDKNLKTCDELIQEWRRYWSGMAWQNYPPVLLESVDDLIETILHKTGGGLGYRDFIGSVLAAVVDVTSGRK